MPSENETPFLFQEEKTAPERMAGRKSLSVLVPFPVDKAYDYAVPDGMDLQPGDYVTVPLGKRELPGIVWGEAEGAAKKLKTIVAKHDLPPMPKVQRDFLDWLAGYTMNARGAVLKMALSAPGALKPSAGVKAYKLSHLGECAFTPPSNLPPQRGKAQVLPLLPPPNGGRAGVGGYRSKPSQLIISRSQELRKNLTDAERKLWHALNNKQLGFKFRRQHPVDFYIADFACVEKGLIIELDGGQHSQAQDYDVQRTKYFESKGFRVLRFWNNEVNENIEGVLQKIAEVLAVPPTPSLPPQGGGCPEGVGGGVSLSLKHRAVLEILRDGKPRRPAEIAQSAGVGAGVVKGLIDKGFLTLVEINSAVPCRNPDMERHGPELSIDQRNAAEHLKSYLLKGGYHAALLDGVTGAGKTEVYFEAVAEALKQNKQVLILLPEIALSNAFLDRFKSRFNCAPALWHSHLTPAQRKTTWRGVAQGECRVVVGARSALFLPYMNLGLIIVDEEHDPAFKQEEGVIYHARDMAVVRASLGKIPIVLVSATPSLETIHNAWNGRYEHLHLPDRFGGARLPDIQIIDMRADKPEPQHFISPTLKKAVAETIQKGGQALLFLNRRGYAPLTLCRTCGHRMECPRCTAWLVEHKAGAKLCCHHCGFETPRPKHCPSCNDENSFAACGPGVERIREEAKEYFPDARILLLASDTADSNEKLGQMLRDIRDHKYDIIIGTQIIAKGHHFPNLTCVGVIDADLGLAGGELRAAERTYQLLHQVAGRAGREEKKGHVYLQTFMPEHRIMKALAHEARDRFLEAEAHERESAGMPPYSRLAGIILSGRDERQVLDTARALGRDAPQGQGLTTLGPAPAPLARLRGKYRYRLLVRADKTLNVQKAIAAWIGSHKIPGTVRVQVDIDPQSFF